MVISETSHVSVHTEMFTHFFCVKSNWICFERVCGNVQSMKQHPPAVLRHSSGGTRRKHHVFSNVCGWASFLCQKAKRQTSASLFFLHFFFPSKHFFSLTWVISVQTCINNEKLQPLNEHLMKFLWEEMEGDERCSTQDLHKFTLVSSLPTLGFLGDTCSHWLVDTQETENHVFTPKLFLNSCEQVPCRVYCMFISSIYKSNDTHTPIEYSVYWTRKQIHAHIVT